MDFIGLVDCIDQNTNIKSDTKIRSMRYITLIGLLFSSFIASSQNVQMAETMRSEGKIYVVIAVLAVILVGLFLYLITIDRKVSKLEKEANI